MGPERRSSCNPYLVLGLTSLGDIELPEPLACLCALDRLEKERSVVRISSDKFYFGE